MRDKLTLDGKEYYLVPVEEGFSEKDIAEIERINEEMQAQELDKYKKIREVVSRRNDKLSIHGDKKTLSIDIDGQIFLIECIYKNTDELHFEECTLGDLKENDVVWFEERAYIIIEIDDSIINTYYFKNDIIHTRELATDGCLFIKILRH